MKKNVYLDRRPRIWPRVVAVCFALVLTLYFTRALWLAALGQYLVKADRPARADAVLVLAGDLTGGRMLVGADLVKRGYAPRAFISGPNDVFGRYESDFAIEYAVAKGYPEWYFVNCHNKARSTRAEAAALLPELRKAGVHRLDLVTSSFHTRRAWNVYRRLAPDLELHVVEAPDKYFSPGTWWKDREGRKTFFFEATKTVAYWFGM